MVATQSQGGITNSYQLDAAGRPRELKVTGSKEATEVFHYAGGSDSPAWTAKGSEWTRSIGGIGGELAAITAKLGNQPAAIQPAWRHRRSCEHQPDGRKTDRQLRVRRVRQSESKNAGRFGWLGGKRRRTELPSGVIQMGVRSYVPAMGRFISTDPVDGDQRMHMTMPTQMP